MGRKNKKFAAMKAVKNEFIVLVIVLSIGFILGFFVRNLSADNVFESCYKRALKITEGRKMTEASKHTYAFGLCREQK